MSKSLVPLLKRAGIAAAFILLANLVVVFFWSPPWFVYWQVPISCTIFILFLGITLYDTLFFDRPR
jgi:hypothetical protein